MDCGNVHIDLVSFIHMIKDMPLIGCGTAGLQGDICTEVVQKALGIGYRHIDTASLYNNHSAIRKAIINSSVPREKIFITSKIWWGNMSYNKVIGQTVLSH